MATPRDALPPTILSTAACVTPATPCGSPSNSSKRANGRQVWADRYDATARDLLAVQDAIAARIARTLAVQIDGARLDVVRRAPLASLEVYDCWLRGLDCLRQGTVAADVEARRFFDRALEIDPSYARAYSGLSLSHFNEWSCQAWAQWDEKERLAYEYARRALSLDENDAMVQVVLGRILVYRRRYDEAAHHLERALMLNPNDTDVLVHAGLCQAYLGEPETALATAAKAMRLNPAFPPWYAAPAGLALFMLGRDRECLDMSAAAPTRMFVDVAAFAAASCALTGDMRRREALPSGVSGRLSGADRFRPRPRSRASRCGGCFTSTRSSGRRTANVSRVG